MFALWLAALLSPWSAPATELGKGEIEQGGYRYAVAPAPDFVQPREVPKQWPSPGSIPEMPRWRTWLVDSQVDHRGGKTRNYHDQAIEPIASELVSEAAKYSIEFNPLYQSLILHTVAVRRDGVWSNRLDPAKVSLARREAGFERDLADGEVTALIVLDDIRARDVVRISYTIVGSNPIVATSQEDSFNLAWIEPVLERFVRVIYPAGTPLDWKIFNSSLKPKLVQAADRVEVQFHAHDMASVRDEKDYPNWYSPFPMAQVAPRRSWADVVAWALPLYPDPGPLPDDLRQKVAEWRRIDDPARQAMAVLRTVQDSVRYFGTEMGDSTHRPAPPSETWQRRYGDCKDKAYLTTTLLRELGLQAEPALVSMSRGRALQDMLPAAELFDHAIVRLRLGAETFWLDPTLTMQRGDIRQLDLGDYGVALPVVAGVTSLQPVIAPKGARNATTVSETFSPSADGSQIELLVKTEYVGRRAEQMRRRLGSTGATELSKEFSEYYRKRYGDLRVIEPLAVDDTDPANVLRLVEHYSLLDGWVEKRGQQRLLDVYGDALSGDVALPAVTDRSGPIGIQRPATLDHEITLVLPDGWTLQDGPDAADVATDEFRYRRVVTRKPGLAVISQRLEMLADTVPDSRVGEFIGKMRDVSDLISLRLDLRTSPAVGKSDRDQRLQRLLREAMDKKGGSHD